MEGTVKWFNNKKGYGFINGDDGVDYFVHFSFITDGSMLRENDRVSFDSEETERGQQAKNVTKLASGEPSE